MSAPVLVQTVQEFGQMMDHLRDVSVLAVDTESDSLFSYVPKVCLIQITGWAPDTAETDDYLVDPLKLDRIEPLGDLLADSSVEVILHAAENDILILQRDFGFDVKNIYDTQLAARILGRNGVGLAAMLEEEFGVASDKKMQRTNWGRRPLTPQQMHYAQQDTHYLPALRRRQIDRLKEAGRWREARDAFKVLELVRYEESENGRTVWSMKGTRKVDLDQMGLLEELWLWREKTAEKLDVPPFKVLRDQSLVQLALQCPASLESLRSTSRMNSRTVERFGRELLAAIERGKERPAPPLPEPTPRRDQLLDDRDQQRYHALRKWRSSKARERGVDPDIVFSNNFLLQIVEHSPEAPEEIAEIPGIGMWKAETYGPEILAVMDRS